MRQEHKGHFAGHGARTKPLKEKVAGDIKKKDRRAAVKPNRGHAVHKPAMAGMRESLSEHAAQRKGWMPNRRRCPNRCKQTVQSAILLLLSTYTFQGISRCYRGEKG